MTQEEYSREELLTAVEEVIDDSIGFEDGFRAGVERGALSVLECLTDEDWVPYMVREELDDDDA